MKFKHLSIVRFFCFGYAQQLGNLLNAASGLGSVVRDIQVLSNALDPNQYNRFELRPTTNESPNGNMFSSTNILEAISRIGNCDPSQYGTCCLTPNYCSPSAKCTATAATNDPTSWLKAVPVCTCLPGYKGDGRASGGTGCENVDECATGEALCEQVCQDLSPGYSCGCHSGFRLQPDNFSCVDIDECAEGVSGCSHFCNNSLGSFSCSCPDGFKMDEGSKICVEISMCSLMQELSGYNGSGSLSTLASAVAGQLEMCQWPELCRDLNPGYTCHCPLGTAPNPTSAGKCVDVNECLDGVSDPLGFLRSLSGSKTADTITANGACFFGDSTIPSQQCTNYDGLFDCECLPGFQLSEASKVQRDHLGEVFISLPYAPNDISAVNSRYAIISEIALATTCEDVDECSFPIDPCTGLSRGPAPPTRVLQDDATNLELLLLGATPTKKPDALDTGSELPTTISPIGSDSAPDSLPANELTNLETSTVSPVFTDTNLITDMKISDASSDSTTTGMPISSTSSESPTTEIPSTSTSTEVSTAEIPTTTQSTTSPEAPTTVTLETSSSTEVPTTEIPTTTASETPTTEIPTTSTSTEVSTAEIPTTTYSESTSTSTTSDAPTTQDPSTSSSPDVQTTEVATTTQTSSTTQSQTFTQTEITSTTAPLPATKQVEAPVCSNTVGSFRCICQSGFSYERESLSCVDIDECQSPSLNLCEILSGERCVNTIGSYQCECATGFIDSPKLSTGLFQDGLNCLDIDECATGTHKCSHQCENTAGSYTCNCPRGFKVSAVDHHTCDDIDECALGVCPMASSCVNLPGGYLCGCPISHQPSVVLDGAPKDIQRSLASIWDEFNVGDSSLFFDWTSSQLISEIFRIEDALFTANKCTRIDVCNIVSRLGIESGGQIQICPKSGTCSQTDTSFHCGCPAGFHMSGQASRRLDASAPSDRALGVAISLKSILLSEVLTDDQIRLGQEIGFLSGRNQRIDELGVPLWVLVGIDWSGYLAQGGSSVWSHSDCEDINECAPGFLKADGQKACPSSSPCCFNSKGGHECSVRTLFGACRTINGVQTKDLY